MLQIIAYLGTFLIIVTIVNGLQNHRSLFVQKTHRRCIVDFTSVPKDRLTSNVPRTYRKAATKLNMLGLPLGLGPLVASTSAVAGVVAFHELGHFMAAKVQGIKITSYNIGYGPKLISFNDSSDIEYALRAFPLGGYVAFPVNVERDDDGNVVEELTDPDLIQNRPPLQRLFVISAGVMANILLTLILSASTAWNSGISTPVYGPGLRVSNVATGPAFMAGIKPKDLLVQIDGKPIKGSDTVVQDFVTFVRTHEGKPIKLTVERPSGINSNNNKADLLKTVTAPAPNNRFETVVIPISSGGKATIGLGINAQIEELNVRKATNFVEALTIGAQTTIKLLVLTFSAILGAISTGFKGADVGGPISVISTGSAMAAASPTGLLGFAATLSVNLAVLNSLPYPALDGGQFVYTSLELITGKKIPRDLQDRINTAAFLVLALFSIYTVVGDVGKLFDPIFSAAGQSTTGSALPSGAMFPDSSGKR